MGGTQPSHLQQEKPGDRAQALPQTEERRTRPLHPSPAGRPREGEALGQYWDLSLVCSITGLRLTVALCTVHGKSLTLTLIAVGW